jgi:hypothetical protein
MNWNKLQEEYTLEPDQYPLATVFRDKEGSKIIAADNATVVDLGDMR